MIIENGFVFEESGVFHKRSLFVSTSHKILAEPEPGDQNTIDADGMYVIPGLVDVHIHGAVGHDFCDQDPDGLRQIAAYLRSNGITSFCPTSMTLPLPQLGQIFQTVHDIPKNPTYASCAGIHMEGPFISPLKKGAQKETHIVPPDINAFAQLNASCGNQIRLVTIAPELPGSIEFIEAYHSKLSVSLGHSNADYDTALSAFHAGANHATHLFNAMPPLLHRAPGLIGAAADSPHVMVEAICDGIHIAPSVIRMIFQIFGDSRVVLISDAMRATGMEDGTYELGGQAVSKKGKYATLPDGTLAGSASNLYDCMKNAVSFGIPLASAIKAATVNPAKSIGADSIGSLRPGTEADIVLLGKDLSIAHVL